MTRRDLLGALAALPVAARRGWSTAMEVLRPRRLRAGDTAVLVSPATATAETIDIDIARDTLEALDLKVRVADHLRDRRGYLAGTDRDRAADINRAFADDAVRAIVALRGGWGSARILPHLDYADIRRHPKVLLGYSDVTALHTAIQAQSSIVTFHGPVGASGWDDFTTAYARRVLFDGETVTFENSLEPGETLVPTEFRTQALTAGVARGRLLGGNLSVLTALLGSRYLPSFDGAILFVEEVGEDLYRVDRMMTALSLAGVLAGIRGFIFGYCVDCKPGDGFGSLTIEEILDDHVRPLGIPAWRGAMIGHRHPQFTLGEGIEVEIDASRATIRMLEPAVTG
jgi:muramoyltetrapeptide carboxypeptidase